MADQTINQLTTVAGQDLDRAADKVAVWDNSATVTKGLPVQDVVTTGTVDPGSSSQVTTRVNKIVACTQTEYDSTIAGGGNTPDPATLYVITDGKTKDSYNGQIDTLTASRKYWLDVAVPADREIIKFFMFYTSGASGAGTITLRVSDGTVDGTDMDDLTFAASQTDQPLGGTAISLDVVAGDTLYLETDGSVADVTDVRFVVEYQS